MKFLLIFSLLSGLIIFSPMVGFAQNSSTSSSSENSNTIETQSENSEVVENDENSAQNSQNSANAEIQDSAENQTENSEVAESSENTENSEEVEKKKYETVIPSAKRPKTADPEKVKLAEAKDTGKDSADDKKNALKYGIETEIIDLLKNLQDNDDPRFSDDIYDLFQKSKSPRLKTAVLDYFSKMEDPCLEDYVVTILDDPFDTNRDLVNAAFRYAAKVKCKAAVPPVMTLLENDNEDYFNSALNTIGEIGSESEAEVMAEYLDREDLSIPQRQTLMKVLGKIKAVGTYDKLVEIVENEDENTYVRAYAAEAIGAMKKSESVDILKTLYESDDPTLRIYALKGLSYFDKAEVQEILIEGLRDSYYKVRLEAIESIKKLEITDAIESLIYRAKTDPESAVKKACYPVLAKFDTSETKEFLYDILKTKKSGDTARSLVVQSILENTSNVPQEVLNIAEETAKDDISKNLRYSIGKQLVKYAGDGKGGNFDNICKLYLESKDVSTQGMGLDLYAIGKYASCNDLVKNIAEAKKKSVNKTKARRILKMPEEDSEEENKKTEQNTTSKTSSQETTATVPATTKPTSTVKNQ